MLVNGQRTADGEVVLHLTPLQDDDAVYVPPSIWMAFKIEGGRLSPARIGIARQADDGPADKWLSNVCGSINVDQERFALNNTIGVVFFFAGMITQESGRIQTDAVVDVSGFFTWYPERQSDLIDTEEASQFLSVGRG